MRLFTYYRSSASFRVRIALALKHATYDAVFIDLSNGQHLDESFSLKSPQRLLPALEADGHVFTQSLAIIDYLDYIAPEPRLIPIDPVNRAHALSMAQIIGCDIHPLNNLRVLKYLRSEFACDEDAVASWYQHWICEGFSALERMVERYGSESSCLGDSLSVADVCLVPQMWNARRFKTDLSAFPNLVKIDARLSAIDAFQSAAPEAQADAA